MEPVNNKSHFYFLTAYRNAASEEMNENLYWFLA